MPNRSFYRVNLRNSPIVYKCNGCGELNMIFEIYFSTEGVMEIDFSKVNLKINCQYCHKYTGMFIPDPHLITIARGRGN